MIEDLKDQWDQSDLPVNLLKEETQDLQVLRVKTVLLVYLEIEAQWDRKVYKVFQDCKGYQEYQVRKEIEGYRVLKETKETLE